MEANALLAEILQQNTLSAAEGVPFSELAGWDSLKMVNMVVRLEQLLKRELSEAELENLNTISDLQVLLKAS